LPGDEWCSNLPDWLIPEKLHFDPQTRLLLADTREVAPLTHELKYSVLAIERMTSLEAYFLALQEELPVRKSVETVVITICRASTLMAQAGASRISTGGWKLSKLGFRKEEPNRLRLLVFSGNLVDESLPAYACGRKAWASFLQANSRPYCLPVYSEGSGVLREIERGDLAWVQVDASKAVLQRWLRLGCVVLQRRPPAPARCPSAAASTDACIGVRCCSNLPDWLIPEKLHCEPQTRLLLADTCEVAPLTHELKYSVLAIERMTSLEESPATVSMKAFMHMLA
jgi:hypothetical protein